MSGSFRVPLHTRACELSAFEMVKAKIRVDRIGGRGEFKGSHHTCGRVKAAGLVDKLARAGPFTVWHLGNEPAA